MTLSYRAARPTDAPAISALIAGLAETFLDIRPGADNSHFYATIAPASVAEKIASSNHVYVVAEDDSGLCGVAGMRDGSHLYQLFIRADRHRQGIGSELWQRLKASSAATHFTVNASRFAVPMYEKLGFVPVGAMQSKDGISFQPMLLERES